MYITTSQHLLRARISLNFRGFPPQYMAYLKEEIHCVDGRASERYVVRSLLSGYVNLTHNLASAETNCPIPGNYTTRRVKKSSHTTSKNTHSQRLSERRNISSRKKSLLEHAGVKDKVTSCYVLECPTRKCLFLDLHKQQHEHEILKEHTSSIETEWTEVPSSCLAAGTWGSTDACAGSQDLHRPLGRFCQWPIDCWQRRPMLSLLIHIRQEV